MANYLLAYVGGDEPDSEEAGAAVMNAWIAWFGTLGDAVVDPGNPIGASAAGASDGSVVAAPAGVTGYSGVTADSREAAIALLAGVWLLERALDFEVYETFPAM
jgi:hypothetical protein